MIRIITDYNHIPYWRKLLGLDGIDMQNDKFILSYVEQGYKAWEACGVDLTIVADGLKLTGRDKNCIQVMSKKVQFLYNYF